MNKKEKTQYLKKEYSELETQEELFKQCLSWITSRKTYLKSELDNLGTSNSARKSKTYNGLSEKQKLEIRASLTK